MVESVDKDVGQLHSMCEEDGVAFVKRMLSDGISTLSGRMELLNAQKSSSSITRL